MLRVEELQGGRAFSLINFQTAVYCQGIYHQSSLKTSAAYFADNLFVDWIDDILELEM